MAWTFISAAASLCQRLGYHRLHASKDNDTALRAAQERLFWIVYQIDKGLSLRLGCASNIRDTEITLLPDRNEPRSTRLARIQGKVYDHLYSPAGLFLPANERGHLARAIARDLRELINETHADVLVCPSSLANHESR